MESESLIFTGLEIPRDYDFVLEDGKCNFFQWLRWQKNGIYPSVA